MEDAYQYHEVNSEQPEQSQNNDEPPKKKSKIKKILTIAYIVLSVLAMALIKCPNCGEQISDKATVCPKCGKTIDSKSQKKTKKEIVNLGIVIAFVAGILVGGMSHALLFNSGKSDDKVIQTEQKESVKTSDKELSKDTTVESNNNENKSDTIKEVAINEPMNITHEYGNYILTVDAVRRCDWLNRFGEDEQPGKVAILLEMDIQNQTYDDPYNDFMFIDSQIIVLDENNYSIQSWGTGYDDGEYHTSPKIPVGTNGKLVIPYIVDDTCNMVTITFNNQYKIVAQITG